MTKKRNTINKSTKQTVIKQINEDTNEVKKLIIILASVGAIALLLYFVTGKYLIKDNFQTNNELINTSITYDTIKAGSIFNRPYDKYYVFAYDSTSTNSNYYNILFNQFKKEKIYFLDLSLDVNKKYISDKANKKASSIEELSLTNPALILIQNGKISDYYDKEDDIIKVLE